jgi:hypothetical protein
MIGFRSPATGHALRPDTPHSLASEAGERWPVLDGIAYLRAGSEPLAMAALARLDAGDRDGALRLLLMETDRWWDGSPPTRAELDRLLAERDRLNLREAMRLLGYGRVGVYFAHRWSDPTFVAGLALIDAHWTKPALAFELACGVGHYLRELGRLGVRTVGADIVFSKLWLARHWVAGAGPVLVCMDAEEPWPVTVEADLALCHDAFYFFRRKNGVAQRLLSTARNGLTLLSHVHNAERARHSAGAATSHAQLTALFPDAAIYADEVLTEAAMRGSAPVPGRGLADSEAFGVAAGPALSSARPVNGPLTRPSSGARLRRNPLLADGAIAWPSPRYEDEYGARATYRADQLVPAEALMDEAWQEAAVRRELVDLPERW